MESERSENKFRSHEGASKGENFVFQGESWDAVLVLQRKVSGMLTRCKNARIVDSSYSLKITP